MKDHVEINWQCDHKFKSQACTRSNLISYAEIWSAIEFASRCMLTKGESLIDFIEIS